MDIWRLQQFVTLAEELHFTRAAARLYVDQGALSASIRKLERNLGVQLFERTSRRVALTPAGERLLPKARDLCARMDELTDAVRRERTGGESAHVLRVGLFLGQHAAAELTGPIMHAFTARYPEIALAIHPLDISDPWGIDSPHLDVLIGRDAGAPGDLVSELFSDPRVLILATDDELATQADIRLGDLLDRSWCSVEDIPPRARDFRRSYVAPEGVRAPVVEVPDEPFVEALERLTTHHILGMTAASAGRLVNVPGVTYREVVDAPPSTVTVLERAPDTRTKAFRDTAVAVTRALQGLVPDASIQ